MKKNSGLKAARAVYASLYSILDQRKLKAHLIVIVGKNGRLEDYIPGPVTIGDWHFSRIRKREASLIVWHYLKSTYPRVKIQPEDIKIYPYTRANRLLFELENR